MNSPPASLQAASLGRRLMSMVYEALMLAAVLMVAAFPFVFAFNGGDAPWFRPLFQLYLLGVVGAYFTWFWTHGGQTLPMKTWRLRVVTTKGSALRLKQALIRYLVAMAGTIFLGFGFLWAVLDRDRQFLHDRLAGTKIVNSKR
ncbi:MAG: RDD family protein [Betaproteobacteria bacterium]|nr:RDD family protein [Betaproteobacteria bacterium]